MLVDFICPHCQQMAERQTFQWRQAPHCPQCGKQPQPQLESAAVSEKVEFCPICGNDRLYRQKDLNRKLGLSIVVVASLAFLLLLAWGYSFVIAMIPLVALALGDLILHRLIKSALVCYRCQSVFRKVPNIARFPPYDIHIAEEYRELG